ncbi:MAG: biotin/lipoyl-binding protein [Bacteroidaceae bacterium]|nr:biotin/lipoyl-binding protein [Bacteroidaceae bacterium]
MEIKIGDRIADVELISKQGNNVRIKIDGTEYDLDIAFVERGGCSILYDGKSFNAEFIRSESGKKYKVNANFSSYDVEIIDSTAKYLRLKKGEDDRQDSKIISPMPGKIVSVLAKPGDKVKAGDTIVVIEAMKMQSNYKVNQDCTIKDILVKEGDTVASDQVLVLLDLDNK